MSIFKHSSGEAKQATASPSPEGGVQTAQPEQRKGLRPLTPPAGIPHRTAAAGVVPPPAAPIYSMRPPEVARTDDDGECAPAASRAGRMSSAREIQRLTQRASSNAQACHGFDVVHATQAGLLNLAWKWQEAGSPIRAIHTYIELLTRYPDTAGAEAAVADLMELSSTLVEQGQFHTALAIYDHLEELLA